MIFFFFFYKKSARFAELKYPSGELLKDVLGYR